MKFNLAKTGRQCSHSFRFQNQTRHLTQTNTHDEGLWFSFHKNYKLGLTYLRLTIFYWQSNTFTSTTNTIVLVIRALCKLVFPNLPQKFDQSTLIYGTPFFSQWYFPLSENLWQIIASSPFLTPCSFMLSCVLAQLASLAQIRELAHRLFRRHP